MATQHRAAQLAERLWTTEDFAQYVGVPVATVYQWRTRGVAPRAVRVGKHLRFHRADVEAWVEQRKDAQLGAA